MDGRAVTPYEALGGSDAVRALVERFYDEMEQNEPELAALHRCQVPGKVSRSSRDNFGLFLIHWLGGPDDYLRQRGHPRLRLRHATVIVNLAMRDAWLRSMTRAMDALGVSGSTRAYLDTRFAEVANFLRNAEEPSAGQA